MRFLDCGVQSSCLACGGSGAWVSFVVVIFETFSFCRWSSCFLQTTAAFSASLSIIFSSSYFSVNLYLFFPLAPCSNSWNTSAPMKSYSFSHARTLTLTSSPASAHTNGHCAGMMQCNPAYTHVIKLMM